MKTDGTPCALDIAYANRQGFSPGKTFGQAREEANNEFERQYCIWLLARHNRNLSAAAREVRMDRKHLYDLAKKHGVR